MFRVATRSSSSGNVLEDKKMFLKFEIAKCSWNVLELQKLVYIFDKNPVFEAFIKDSHTFYDSLTYYIFFTFPICLNLIMLKMFI